MWKRTNRRRKKSWGIPSFPWSVACILLIGLVWCAASVWIDGRIGTLNRDIVALESEAKNLERAYKVAECRWMRMKSPSELAQILDRHGVVMMLPSNDQIVRLADPSVSVAADAAADGDLVGFARIERLMGYE